MGEFVSHYWILCAGAWPRARLPGQPAIEWPGSFYFRWLYNSSKAGLRVSETQHYLWHGVARAATGRGFCGAGWAIDDISGHRQGARPAQAAISPGVGPGERHAPDVHRCAF